MCELFFSFFYSLLFSVCVRRAKQRPAEDRQLGNDNNLFDDFYLFISSLVKHSPRADQWRMWKGEGAIYTHAAMRKKKIKIKLSLTKMENSLVDVIAPVFFFLSFRLSPGFENVYVRFFATALWCGGIGREIEPPQLRISSYPSSWNKLVASTFGSLSNFSPTPTLTKDGTSMEREALLFFSLLVSAFFLFFCLVF